MTGELWKGKYLLKEIRLKDWTRSRYGDWRAMGDAARKAREEAVKEGYRGLKLVLEPGQTILDLPCMTIAQLSDVIIEDGHIIKDRWPDVN